MRVEVHKVEVLIINFDGVGPEGVKTELENAHYANRCISPSVMVVQTREVEWSDDHPLNKADTNEAAYRELFDVDSA